MDSVGRLPAGPRPRATGPGRLELNEAVDDRPGRPMAAGLIAVGRSVVVAGWAEMGDLSQ
jgi:hypothetical protein